jgi:hypothetical protein
MHSAVETFMKKFISVFIVFISLSGTSIASNDQTGTVDSVNIPKKEVTIKILSGNLLKWVTGLRSTPRMAQYPFCQIPHDDTGDMFNPGKENFHQ